MRIRRSPQTESNRTGAVRRDGAPSRRPGGPALLWAALVLAIVAAVGLWVGFEGVEIAASWFRGRAGTGRAAENGLPTLYLEIGSRDYRRMGERRQEAVQAGGLWQADEPTRGRIRFHQERFEAVVRLREGPIEQPEGMWSFQVDLQDALSLLELRAFSAQPVDPVSFAKDWWYAQGLGDAGILATRCALVNFSVNGEDWGTYVLRDAFTEQWLASQGRSGGAIVRLDARALWEQQARLGPEAAPERALFLDPAASAVDGPAFARVDERRVFVYGDSTPGGGDADAAKGLLDAFSERRMLPSQAFDAERLGRYLAHANLWGARHGLMWHEMWAYYNPATMRLEPIGHDARALEPAYASFVDLAQYEDPAVMEAYVREAARIAQPGYLASLRAAHAGAFAEYEAALSSGAGREDVPWDLLAERQALLTAALNIQPTVRAYATSLEPGATLEIEMANLARYPVALRRLVNGSRVLDIEPEWIVEPQDLAHSQAAAPVVLRGMQRIVPRYLLLRVPADEIAPLIARLIAPEPAADAGALQMVTHLVGREESVVVDVQIGDPSAAWSLQAPSVQDALARYPFLERLDRPGVLALQAGTWPVDGDLVLPQGVALEASGPVTLTFAPGAVFYSGEPLRLQGRDGAGIHLVPRQESWGGLVVYRAGTQAPSSLRNVEVRGARGGRLLGDEISGGVTFYESAARLENCRLVDTTASDALRLVRTYFEIEATEIVNASGDAIDADQSQGRIEGCAFRDVLGDGVRVRAGRVDVQRCSFARVYDQAISAGQGSLVVVQDVDAADVGLAVVSSDLSHVQAHNLRVEQAWLGDLAAYGRADAYGQASLQVSGVSSQGEEPILALVQPGSRVTVEGVEVEPNIFELAALEWRAQTLSGVRMMGHRFGGEIRLLGYALDASAVASGGPVRLVLYWQALAEIEREYTVFVHAVDASGQLVAQWDAMPRANEYPTTHWLAGRVVDDPHSLQLPAGLAPGSYRLIVGLYEWQSGERLPLERPDGVPVPDGTLILEPQIEVG